MSATGDLPLDFLCPAGDHHQHHRAIEKLPPPPQQQQRQPHTKHLPPGLPGAVEGRHHHHHHQQQRPARTPASSSSSSSSDAGDGSTPQQAISTYLRRISQAAEALAAAADQEDHALRADGVLPSDGNLLVMEAICRETVAALRAVRQCNRAVAIAAASSSASPSPSPGGRTAADPDYDDDGVGVTPSASSINPRKRLLSPPPHLRRHRGPAPTIATTTAASSSSTNSSAAAAAAAEAKGAAAAAGTAPPAPRRRRACAQCGCTETPFWRRGPLGSRSLCNVCGLLYARRARDRREASRGRTLQWAGSTSEGVGDLASWRGSGGSSGSLFP